MVIKSRANLKSNFQPGVHLQEYIKVPIIEPNLVQNQPSTLTQLAYWAIVIGANSKNW